MQRNRVIGRFGMCAGSMLRHQPAKIGFVIIGANKMTACGAKKPGRIRKMTEQLNGVRDEPRSAPLRVGMHALLNSSYDSIAFFKIVPSAKKLNILG